MKSNVLVAALRAYLPASRADAKKLGVFLAAVVLLNIAFNLRFPAPELHFWYLLPSLDVVMILGSFALVGLQGWRVPKLALGTLAALATLTRVLRFGDGIQQRFYSERFSLYGDLPLAPEGVRFAHSALPFWKFWPLAFLVVALAVLLPILFYRALRVAEEYLANSMRAPLVGLFALVAFGIGLVPPRELLRHGPLFTGGFGSSILPRIRREGAFMLSAYTERGVRSRIIARVQEELEKTPSRLDKLGKRDVHLILVESYGDVAVDRPEFARTLAPTFESIESELGASGFRIASGRMSSPTFGGRSWLAHATLATGVPTTDQFGYDLLPVMKPKPMAAFFRDAGYRTVIVHPGTTRPWPKGEFYRFNEKYYYWNFEYAGPAFAWATMPDQFVLDVIRRRELERHSGPLFIQYVLISSHAPWSETPTIVEDWSRIGNGAIFDTQPVLRYPVVWPNFQNAREPYIRSIVYDFEVLKRFIQRFIRDDALVIVLGDHQPVVEVSGDESKRGVPVHVFSREDTLIEPFRRRGYVPGMWPRGTGEARKMETFLFDFLRDFSTADVASR